MKDDDDDDVYYDDESQRLKKVLCIAVTVTHYMCRPSSELQGQARDDDGLVILHGDAPPRTVCGSGSFDAGSGTQAWQCVQLPPCPGTGHVGQSTACE